LTSLRADRRPVCSWPHSSLPLLSLGQSSPAKRPPVGSSSRPSSTLWDRFGLAALREEFYRTFQDFPKFSKIFQDFSDDFTRSQEAAASGKSLALNRCKSDPKCELNVDGQSKVCRSSGARIECVWRERDSHSLALSACLCKVRAFLSARFGLNAALKNWTKFCSNFLQFLFNFCSIFVQFLLTFCRICPHLWRTLFPNQNTATTCIIRSITIIIIIIITIIAPLLPLPSRHCHITNAAH